MATIWGALGALAYTVRRAGYTARVKIAAVTLAMAMSMTCWAAPAHAATCDVTSSSTSGISISFSAVGQTVVFCPTSAQVKWGIYWTTGIDSPYNQSLLGNGHSVANPGRAPYPYSDYTATTSNATYLIHPAQGSAASGFTGELDITLQSVTNGGADSFILYTASGYTYDGSYTLTPGYTAQPITDASPTCQTRVGSSASPSCLSDTPFTISITALPAVAPTVTAVSPTSGPAAGGNTVTVTGTNFVSGANVNFGATPATNVSVASSTSLTATAPAGTGTVGVSVTTTAGTNTLANAYTYITPPVADAQNVTTAFGTAKAITLTASNSPASYAVATGPTHGTLSGTPPNLTYTPTAGYRGSDSFTFTATNGGGTSAPATVSITVTDPVLTLNGSPSSGTRGTAYSTSFTASGGTSPYTYAITGGALPAGLTLATDGTLSGTPAASGSFTFSVTVTDSTAGTPAITKSGSYTINIAAPTLSLAPASLTGATVGATYNQTISASGGTTPYTYTVSAGALPPGLSLSSSGALSGTPTASGVFNFTVTATDGSSVASGGPYTTSAAYSVTVGAPTISLNPTTLPAGTSGTAYSEAISANGGTTPYTYAVTAGALPTGLTLASDGTLSGTPAASGSFSFSVTATDSSGGSGPYTATRAYTLAIAAPTLSMAPASLTGATVGAAFSQTLNASGGLVPYTYAVTAGALPAGVTLATNGTLSGIPTAGGTYNFTVTATDATASSNGGPYGVSQSYSLTVGGATVVLAPTSLPSGTSGTAYSQPISASGGTAPYTYAVASGSLPAGLTLSSDGTLSGTPTASGSFTFSVTATDSSTGNGPYMATHSFTLAIAAPTLTLAPATLTGATVDSPFSQTLSAAGGTAPYTYTVTAGTLPKGLTLATDGKLSGIPTADGSYTFTVTATDSTASASGGPYSVSKSYTMVVGLPPAPITQNSPQKTVTGATATAPQSISIDLSSLVSGDYSDIQISTQPQHGTVSVAHSGGQFVATYSPTANYAGPDSFGFVAIGPGGRSDEAHVAIKVVGVVPVAPNLRATTISGQPVVVDLTATANGSPFTSARIVAISPADSATADLIEAGTADSRLYQLQITPGGRFSGTATVQYTLSNVFGESAVATVTVAVTARPDPTRDPLVTGIITAQAASTERFAQTQTDNFMRRTEQLHGGGGNGSPLGLTVSGGDSSFENYRADQSPAMFGPGRVNGLRQLGGAPVLPTQAAYGSTGRMQNVVLASPSGASTRQDVGANGVNNGSSTRRIGSIAIWTGGAIDVGTRDATTNRDHLSISSNGLSSGADIKLSDTLIVGAGGGYGADRTKIGTEDRARVDGDNWVGAIYGSYSPANGAFLDGVAGFGHLHFDTRRSVAINNSIARGSRDGSMLFGSLAAGFDRTTDRFSLSAYSRLNLLTADLDAYSETGAALFDLAFAKRTLNSISSTLGLRGGIALGRWTPRARVEWLHEFKDTGVQALDYADLTGYTYSVHDAGWLRDTLSVEIGVGYQGTDGWQFGLDAGGQIASGARSASGKITVGKHF